MEINMKAIAVILISSTLSACGGEISVASNDGITGTGITAGRVTGFGSIYVNGIKFDVNNATFSRDGVFSTDQSEFSIGEYVIIKGSIDKTKATGIADEVSFNDILEGAVTLVSKDDIRIEILGQQVEVNQNTTTLLIDSGNLPAATFTKLSDLAVGNIVEVSGVKDSNGLIKATSIKLKEVSGSENQLKGTISELDTPATSFKIGSIFVDYSEATIEDFNGPLLNGQFVEVKSSTVFDGITLFATSVKLKDEVLTVETGTEFEVEGIVTRYVSNTDFDVNGIPTTTNSDTSFENGATITLNSLLEVEGRINNSGILVAEEIKFED